MKTTKSSPQMTAIGVVQGAGGVQEEQVVGVLAIGGGVLGEPKIPEPGVGKRKHDQPFTPLEAMLLMNERWNAMNNASTGMVINEA